MSTKPYDQAPTNVIPFQPAEDHIATVQTGPAVFDQAPQVFDRENIQEPGTSSDITLDPKAPEVFDGEAAQESEISESSRWDKKDTKTAALIAVGTLAVAVGGHAVNEIITRPAPPAPAATRYIEVGRIAKTLPGDTIKLPAQKASSHQ